MADLRQVEDLKLFLRCWDACLRSEVLRLTQKARMLIDRQIDRQTHRLLGEDCRLPFNHIGIHSVPTEVAWSPWFASIPSHDAQADGSFGNVVCFGSFVVSGFHMSPGGVLLSPMFAASVFSISMGLCRRRTVDPWSRESCLSSSILSEQPPQLITHSAVPSSSLSGTSTSGRC